MTGADDGCADALTDQVMTKPPSTATHTRRPITSGIDPSQPKALPPIKYHRASILTALVVGAVGAFHLLRDPHLAGPRVMFSMAMWMATLVAPIQMLAGDQHGLNTLEHQPVKIMGMEGHYQSHPDGAPLILFGLPDQQEGKVKYALEIPKMGSLILKHLRDSAYRLSSLLLIAMLGAIVAVSIATPFLHAQYTQRWFAWPNIILTAPVPIAVAAVTALLVHALTNKYDHQPFFLSLALFALSYAGLGISMYPFIVPQSITIWQAAAPGEFFAF